MKILDYIYLIFKTWHGVLTTVSLLLGLATPYMKVRRIPVKNIGRYIIIASCIGLFYSGFTIWNNCNQKLLNLQKTVMEPHFKYYGGHVFYGRSNEHKGQVFIMCEGLVSNRYGIGASILGWSMKLTLSDGRVMQGIMLPNVPKYREVKINKGGDTIIASSDYYLPDLTMHNMSPGESRAGWLWAIFPVSSDELEKNLPATLAIGYVDSYSEKLSETSGSMSKENVGNVALFNAKSERRNMISTDKIKKK